MNAQSEMTAAESTVIVGTGLSTAAGVGVEAAWEAVNGQRACLAPIPETMRPFVRSQQACMSQVELGPDRLQRMAWLAIREALRGKELEVPDALCIGSSSDGFADLETLAEAEAAAIQPGGLTESLGESLRVTAGARFQCSQACASSAYALALGHDLISQGRYDFVLAGGVDQLTAATLAGFESCRIAASTCRPFDLRRRGTVLGEAAGFVLLCSRRLAEARNLPILALVSGVGLSCDAYNPAAPQSDGRGTRSAILQALNGCGRQSIGFVCAHGTGTIANDASEGIAIRDVFGPHGPPVASYKGSLGHPQGASGICGVILATKVLSAGHVFPSTGLMEQDPRIDVHVARTGEALARPGVLVLSSGSWGANAAIVVTLGANP